MGYVADMTLLQRCLTGLVLLWTLTVAPSACFIDFTEAIPCESSGQCPDGFVCDLATEQCTEGADDAGQTSPSDALDDDVASDTGDPADTAMADTDALTDGDTTPAMDGDTSTMGPCPEGMAPITDAPAVGMYCIDHYEASRPDATDTFEGIDTSMATSRPGVLPWTTITPPQAEEACTAAGKRLCTQQEWIVGCGGSSIQNYPYSTSMYVQENCNASGQVQATGSFPACVFADYMTFDMSGNVSEIIAIEGSGIATMGGSY
ncbi:MAG: SUMF1/EgtB/PvdO family nonheme iron enzyme, partial [Myxococcota bacterium]